VGQTLAVGRPIRNKLGSLAGFKRNRTTIEVTTKPSEEMERKIDRLLTIVEELSNKCRAQEDQITDLEKYVSDAWDEIITNQEEVYQSRHACQLMPGGTLTDNGETRPIKKPVEEHTEKPAAKPAKKTERNKVIPATRRTINPTHGLWSMVAQGGNFNKSEFTDIGCKRKPIKHTIQRNEMTKVPGPQHTAGDDRRRIHKRDWKITATTNTDWQLISTRNRALATRVLRNILDYILFQQIDGVH
jgi:hypothetical protein